MSEEPDLTNPDLFAVWTTDTVRYGDLDPNGHVNNGAINQFFEDGRVHFRQERLSDADGDKLTGFAVVKFSVSYRSPAHYPGAVDIGTVVTRVGTSSYGLGQGVFQDDRCIATAEVVTVHFDPETSSSKPLPDDIRGALQAATTAS